MDTRFQPAWRLMVDRDSRRIVFASLASTFMAPTRIVVMMGNGIKTFAPNDCEMHEHMGELPHGFTTQTSSLFRHESNRITEIESREAEHPSAVEQTE